MVKAIELEIPSGEILRSIQQELNEDETTRDRGIDILKDWLQKQPHLPNEWEEICLVNFLRACNFSVEKAKKKLDMYFTMRAACPELFSNRNINNPDVGRKRGQFLTLPNLTSDGRRVAVGRLKNKDEVPDILQCSLKYALMIADIRIREETAGVAGDVYILDAINVTLNDVIQTPVSLIKKILICVQDSLPVKIKQVHIINPPHFTETIFNMVKPFLKEKLRSRIFIHKYVSDLLEFLPKANLPTEYGGEAGSLEEIQESWIKKLEDYIDWFEEKDAYKADESLRPGKPTNYDELFGTEGSFKQLTID